MKKKLFEYAVLQHTTDENGKTTDTQLVIQPTTVLATSEKDVLFTATRAIPEEYAKDPDNVEIVVRPF